MTNEKTAVNAEEIAALEARLLIARGKKTTAAQREAAKEYDRKLIDAFLHSCPRSQYSALANKQIKLLDDVARSCIYLTPE